jgi:leader peptidase (prepilin peptidase)/N-methyltransferase
MLTFATVFTVVAAPAFASFGMLMGDRWRSERPTADYLRDIAVRPSTCDGCAAPVRPWALTPIFGWWFAGGKCACKKLRLTPFYFIIETLALLFALAAVRLYGDLAWTFLPAIAGMTAAARSDYRTREVHESAWALIWLSAALFLFQTPDPLSHLATPAIFLGLFLPICFLYLKMGRIPAIPMGDFFLIAGLTAFLDMDRGILFAAALIPAILIVAMSPKGGMPFLPKAPALAYAAAAALLAPHATIAALEKAISALVG